MLSLPLSLDAWGDASFDTIFKREVTSLDANHLPLQQGLQHSSYALTDNIELIVLNKTQDDTDIIIKAGLFYNGIIAGCSCSDDPSPTDLCNEYCDVLFRINRQTAVTTVTLI